MESFKTSYEDEEAEGFRIEPDVMEKLFKLVMNSVSKWDLFPNSHSIIRIDTFSFLCFFFKISYSILFDVTFITISCFSLR